MNNKELYVCTRRDTVRYCSLFEQYVQNVNAAPHHWLPFHRAMETGFHYQDHHFVRFNGIYMRHLYPLTNKGYVVLVDHDKSIYRITNKGWDFYQKICAELKIIHDLYEL